MDLVPGSLTGAWTIGPPCLVFVACAYFTRAPVVRVLAALVSGAAVAGFAIAADVLAAPAWVAALSRPRRPRFWASRVVAGAGIGVSGVSLICVSSSQTMGADRHHRFPARLGCLWLHPRLDCVARDARPHRVRRRRRALDRRLCRLVGRRVGRNRRAGVPSRPARPGCARSTANPATAEQCRRISPRTNLDTTTLMSRITCTALLALSCDIQRFGWG